MSASAPSAAGQIKAAGGPGLDSRHVAAARRHLLGMQGLSPDRVRSLLASARDASAFKRDALDGRTIANLFFEDSTRTRCSFTLAARRLGADVLDITARGSSMSKGESIIDTARTIEAMGVDAMVVRTREAGGAAAVAGAVACPVINAGDGRHEHPTQALVDALTLARATGRETGFDLSGLRVVIVGDIVSSRVARSDIAALTALGAEVVCCGPEAMVPAEVSGLGCGVSHDLDGLVGEVDAVICLRIQFERHGEGAPEVSREEYRARFGMTVERADRLREGAWVMHPGPFNRGLEIDGPVADGERSLILDQVAHGPPVRMAVLHACVSNR